MKLSKLYSNKAFHNITFITNLGGVNLILGDAKNKQDGSNSHSLGKSKLVDLLDFMLLKGVDKSFFFYKDINEEKFKGYEFYLEILLNSGKYLTIYRAVDSHTKISFKLNNTKSDGYYLYDTFDKTLSFEKAKVYLNELLNFDFCKETHEDYRRLVSYSLRTQGDYEPKMNTIFQLRKFAKNKDKDWKPLLFSLLGFDGDILKKKYELEETIKEENNTIKAQEKDFGVKAEDKDLLVGKIQNAQSEKDELLSQLNNLNFYNQDKEIIKNLAGSIEEEIADLNNKLYNLEYDVEKLQRSIRNEFSFDINRVKLLFEDVKLFFPEQLSKSYEELINFNRQITQERNTQIYYTLSEKKREEHEINSKLLNLNKQREEFRDLIHDTSLFKKFAVYQKKLVEIEKELSKFQTQLDAVEEIEKRKQRIEEKQNNELQDIRNQLKEIIDNTAKCLLYMNIRKTFSDIVKRILNETALIKIKPTSNYNIEFKPEFPNSAQDEGNTYYKMLCIAFDLSILINYRNKSHFRFVYHDDAIADYDPRLKPRLIEVIRETCLLYDIQYIFSAIEGNLPPSENFANDIILELDDKNDDGKLFKMSF